MTAVAIQHRKSILEQLSSGYLLKQIAAQYGVSKQAIQQALKGDEGYKQALKNQAESLIEEAKEETWAAREALDIARAREMVRFAFRYGESVDPEAWGQRTQVQVTGSLGDLITEVSARMLEALPEAGSSAQSDTLLKISAPEEG